MQPYQENDPNHDSGSEQRPFAPFVVNTLKVSRDCGLYFDSVSYNEKHDLIIACPTDNSVKFFDATTLLPSKRFKTQNLRHDVAKISFCSETNTLIFGCQSGRIYSFNLSNKTLKKLERPILMPLYGIVFISSDHYAFSQYKSHQLDIGNLENGDLFSFPLGKGDELDLYSLESLPKRSLLFSSLNDGSVVIHRTDCLPKLPILYAFKGNSGGLRRIQSVTIYGKEYIAAGSGSTIEIWHLIKGKMRRAKVVWTREEVKGMVYLENYKMIATTHNTQEVRFWRLPSGKLEHTFHGSMRKYGNIFYMKEQNALGVASLGLNIIEIIQLHPLVKERKASGVFEKSKCNVF